MRIPGELSLSDFYGPDMTLMNRLLRDHHVVKIEVPDILVWYISVEASELKSGEFAWQTRDQKH